MVQNNHERQSQGMLGAVVYFTAALVVLNFARIGLFIALGVKALNEKTITIRIVDKLIDRYMDKE